jgi:2-(1,2-epoxy-1,2-dihydrophenyl)acetyl-CoA isomerase
VIAAKSAKFIQSFASIGLIPDSGGTWVLPRLVGQARALGLALTAEPLPAEKAAEWGLIWRAVEDAELDAGGGRACDQIRLGANRGARRDQAHDPRQLGAQPRRGARPAARYECGSLG